MSRAQELFWNGIVVLTLLFLGIGYFGLDRQQASAPVTALEKEVVAASDAVPAVTPSVERIRSIYVPAYSVLPTGSGRSLIDLATALIVHNTSRDQPLVIKRISYFDMHGQFVEEFLKDSVHLPPLGTTQAFVAAEDRRGGTGANFIVDWVETPGATEPLVEVVLTGVAGTMGYSFVTRGHPVHHTAAP